MDPPTSSWTWEGPNPIVKIGVNADGVLHLIVREGFLNRYWIEASGFTPQLSALPATIISEKDEAAIAALTVVSPELISEEDWRASIMESARKIDLRVGTYQSDSWIGMANAGDRYLEAGHQTVKLRDTARFIAAFEAYGFDVEALENDQIEIGLANKKAVVSLADSDAKINGALKALQARSESRYEILSEEALAKFKAGANDEWITRRKALVLEAIQERTKQITLLLSSTKGGSDADVKERFEAVVSTMNSMVRAFDFLTGIVGTTKHVEAGFRLWKALADELLNLATKPYTPPHTKLSLFQALESGIHKLALVAPGEETYDAYSGGLSRSAGDLDRKLAGPDISSLKDPAALQMQIAEIRHQLTEEPFNVEPATLDDSNAPSLITVPADPHDFRTQILLHAIKRLKSNEAWSQKMYDTFAAATNFSESAAVEFSLDGNRDAEISNGVVRLHKRFEVLFSDKHIDTVRNDLELNTLRDLFFLLMVKLVTVTALGTGSDYENELMGLGAQAAAYRTIEVSTNRNDETRLKRLDEQLKLVYPARLGGETHSGYLIHVINAIRNIRDSHIYSEP